MSLNEFLLFCSKGSKRVDKDDDMEEDEGVQGFSRDFDVNGRTGDVDAAEVDDELVNDEEEMKSEEPDDGEDLDDRIDE